MMYGNGQQWVLPFLPYGSELLYSSLNPNQAHLQLIDLDADGRPEVIGIFRTNQELTLFVLKEHFGHLRLISVIKGSGYQVSYLGTAYLKDRDQLSIIVGWQQNPNWSKLSIYKWKKARGIKEEKLDKEYYFSKIDVEDMPGRAGKDGLAELALWLHDREEAYRVQVLRWAAGKLERARDVEPYYFKKVAAHYRRKMREHPNNPLYYAYLQDAEQKAGTAMRSVYLFPANFKDIGGNKWGYINQKGEFILAPQFDVAGDFSDNGLAIVRLHDHDGVIDANGYFIVKPKYDTIQPFSEGRAVVIDQDGFKLIDESGKEITNKAYSFIGDFKDGRAVIAEADEHGQNLYGYLNRMGKEVLSPQYEAATEFHEGHAVVKEKNGGIALIGLTGKIIQRYPYPAAGEYGEGLLAFQKEEKYGYIDEQGKMIIPPQFAYAGRFENGRAIVQVTHENKNYFGLIDKKGHYIIKPNFNSLKNLGEGLYSVGKSSDPEKPYMFQRFAVADRDGRFLTGFLYDGISDFNNALASAYNEYTVFFIDKSGKRVEHLPNVNGRGTLTFDKTLIRGDIDFRRYYFSENGELVWKPNKVIPLGNQKEAVEHKFRPNKDYMLYYPQINGISNAANQELKAFAGVKGISEHEQLKSTYTGDYQVTFRKNNLVVIMITGYDYSFGAAHGMPVRKYAHIDLATSTFYHLKDLFKGDYVKRISEIISGQIKNNPKYDYVFPNSFKGVQPDQPFFIDDAGLNIFFNPYDIAPYAAGFPVFTIPFADIADQINHDGAFWKSFHE
jgi:hypothetical protein